MQRFLSLVVAVAFAADSVCATTTVVPACLKHLAQPQQESVQKAALFLDVRFDEGGKTLFVKRDQDERAYQELFARRMMTFLSRLPAQDPEGALALALRSYLEPRMPAKDLENNAFLQRDKDGKLVLTPIGKNALLDILLAVDGQSLEPLPEPKKPSLLTAIAETKPVEVKKPLTADNLAEVKNCIASKAAPEAAFDGAKHELGGFDWLALDQAVAVPGSLNSVSAPSQLDGYAFDKEKGTVRVMVAGKNLVSRDQFKAADPSAAFAETGLDSKLFESHGAKVVRAVDNIVTVDVPISRAAALGLALQEQGVESRPARLFRAATAALQTSPASVLMGGQFLPIPTADPGKIQVPMPVDPKVPQGDKPFLPWLWTVRPQISVEKLADAGMTGKGTLVGIIDSGIDADHPDFKDANGKSRVQSVMDFTGEGNDDVVGHGTHVSGVIGGTGAASDGRYKGMAADTRYKVAKVFGAKGETDESVILAAMKWMAGGDKPEEKVDVLNMSLGGPGEANKDPLSAMANQLTAKGNILVVAASGNSGPFDESVSSPGNARYALTVGGVDKDGKPAFFSSRGPAVDAMGRPLYTKPDLMGVSGNVDLTKIEEEALKGLIMTTPGLGAGLKQVMGSASGGKCIYSPGVIAPRSGKDGDTVCVVEGNTNYRYMSGTSQATPMAAGFALDVIGYAKSQGAEYDAFQVKAALMETAKDLGEKRETQGSGLLNGERLVKAVTDRVQRGLPIGNVAYSLSMRLTSNDEAKLKQQTRYQMTPLGLLDTQTGHLVNNETDMDAAIGEIRRAQAPLWVKNDISVGYEKEEVGI
ncbi:MAG: S8 family serine peptidase [Elusimicrobiota bacterium]